MGVGTRSSLARLRVRGAIMTRFLSFNAPSVTGEFNSAIVTPTCLIRGVVVYIRQTAELKFHYAKNTTIAHAWLQKSGLPVAARTNDWTWWTVTPGLNAQSGLRRPHVENNHTLPQANIARVTLTTPESADGSDWPGL